MNDHSAQSLGIASVERFCNKHNHAWGGPMASWQSG